MSLTCLPIATGDDDVYPTLLKFGIMIDVFGVCSDVMLIFAVVGVYIFINLCVSSFLFESSEDIGSLRTFL
jgi:hypothetical protein